jgi:hypothetical protein
LLKAITVLAKTINPCIVKHFKETAVHASAYGGVRGRQKSYLSPLILKSFESKLPISVRRLLKKNYKNLFFD